MLINFLLCRQQFNKIKFSFCELKYSHRNSFSYSQHFMIEKNFWRIFLNNNHNMVSRCRTLKNQKG
jgi:hypothetical protein